MFKCLKKKHLQQDDVRKTFSVSEIHREQRTIPRAAKQLPDKTRGETWSERGWERREAG